MLACERVNSVSLERSIACPEDSASGQFALTSLVFEALAIHRVPLKEAALALGYDPGYFSRIKCGEKPLPLDRVWLLTDDVRATFFALGAARTGQRVVRGDARRRVLGKLLTAMGEAIEELDEPQLELPLDPKRMAKAVLR